ncbi:MAG: SDR family oxidoreductase [Methylococcaceae bacterium]|jgi:NAD(P)-dependent dehydrogenase (short-subunit alcohol dehydrogenase family)
MDSDQSTLNKFRLDGRVAIITGGAGLLGRQHAAAIAESGGIPVLWDVNQVAAESAAEMIRSQYNTKCIGQKVDITELTDVQQTFTNLLEQCGAAHILINNAANDPKVEASQKPSWSRLENFPLDVWNKDIAVGLTGAFLCSRVVGTYLAEQKRGVILNIASDLGVIAPDQRIYRQDGVLEEEQPVKPVTYSVVKHGIIGLTKYLATYWAGRNVRVNALSPGGIYNKQDEIFVQRLTNLVPLGRMATVDEYKAAILFLVSDASSYMTGTNIVIDGGRTCW